MELVSKIFETLEISQLALLQLGLVIALAFLLSTLLIRPILRTFEERENLSIKPVEESHRLLSEADEKARKYDEALRKWGGGGARPEAPGHGRGFPRPNASRWMPSSRRRTGRSRSLKGRVAAEKDAAAALLRAEVSKLSVEIAQKVLGRQVA